MHDCIIVTMSLMMCRVCLVEDTRMYTIINTPLQEVFEKVTNISLPSNDGKPVLACYICLPLLRKCHVLSVKARKADQILNQLIHSGIELSQPPYIDRQSYNLTSGHCISPIEHIDIVDDSIKLAVKHEDKNIAKQVKEEPLKVEEFTEEGPHQPLSDVDHHPTSDLNHHSSSDSDDDVPLKNISLKKRAEKKVARVKKKEWAQKKQEKGFTADFAKEIFLTREEQQQELLERSKSVNYINSPLKCGLCYKGFVDERAYRNHTGKHDPKSGPYECSVCRMRYNSGRQLRTHAVTSHSRRYLCGKCPHRSHTANQAREHEKWHSGFTYECKLCGHAFKKPTSYLTHKRKRHPTQHVCDICGDSFVGRHGLLMHRSKTHREDESTESPTEPASQRYCSECDIQFMTMDAWKRHILSSVKHTLASENSAQCKICDVRFPSSAILAVHLKEHTKVLNAARSAPMARKMTAEIACEQCGSCFVNRSKLQAHVKRIHLGLKYNKNIVCELCGKKCTSNASLKYHQRTHTGEKPYQCDVCNKRFADNNQRRIHTRTHTGERPYCCAACGKRFSQKPALNRHYRVHTGAKPYQCPYCSKPFSQSNSMKLHVRAVHLKMAARRDKMAAAQSNTHTTTDTI